MMNGSKRSWISLAGVLGICAAFSGCGGGGGGGLSNSDPGNNDLNVVVAFGDSLTKGSECECTPYPTRLTGLIGKSVLNTGVPGSKAADNVGRTQEAIDKYRPAFMLILYGINDIIHSDGVAAPLGALSQMVQICKDNNVVPVLATYPRPTSDHTLYALPTQLMNDGIRELASAEGIYCVDLEREFLSGGTPNLELYQYPDGLHPNDAGTQAIALAFADLF